MLFLHLHAPFAFHSAASTLVKTAPVAAHAMHAAVTGVPSHDIVQLISAAADMQHAGMLILFLLVVTSLGPA
jgi:hypothetical protein